MKTVTSSIALAALVALGAFVLPCLSNQHPYEELNDYLVKNVHYGGLKDHTNKVNELILSMGTTFTDRDEIFRQLAIHFSFLNDEKNQHLCGVENLSRLQILVESAQNYHQTCPNARTKARRLNHLLIETKHKVSNRCYDYILSRWEDVEKDGQAFSRIAPSLLQKLNEAAKSKYSLLKSLICCSEATEESTTINKESIIAAIIHKALDHEYPKLSLWIKKPESLQKIMEEYLFDPCHEIISNEALRETIQPLLEALRLELMEFPEDKRRSAYKNYYDMIEPLPVYLVCEWIKSKGPNELRSLVENVHKLLMNEGESSSGG